jgi:hypothetical protein
MSKDKEKETGLETFKDVVFFYTSCSREIKQLNKENKKPMSDHPLEMHSWEVKVAIPESRFKKWKKKFAGAKNFPNAKDYTTSEYAEKLDPNDVEPDEDMVLIKFAQSCLSGKATSRKPSRHIKQIGIRGSVQDYDGNTIDQDTQIGNGTKGHLQVRPVETEHGLYLYPAAICITEWIEYVEKESIDEEAFGIEELPVIGLEDDSDDAPAEESEGEDDVGF